MATLAALRGDYHHALHQNLFGLRVRNGQTIQKTVGGTAYPVYTAADSHNATSVVLTAGVAQRLSTPQHGILGQGSTFGSRFEAHTRKFVEDALDLFSHLQVRKLVVLPGQVIAGYAQFAHLHDVEELIQDNPQLQAALGGDYFVDPDILVVFDPFSDQDLNAGGAGLATGVADLSPLRAATSSLPILHASISCKWTMRRDRAQNTRLEALNLVRNRKGRLPHVAAVTMECDPEILGSLCLGTGDIDCLYHPALHELVDAAQHAAQNFGGPWAARAESLDRMVNGSRLRDIADLPLDLMI